jgi:hypothetical protein
MAALACGRAPHLNSQNDSYLRLVSGLLTEQPLGKAPGGPGRPPPGFVALAVVVVVVSGLLNPRRVDYVSARVGNCQFNPQVGTLFDQLWVR